MATSVYPAMGGAVDNTSAATLSQKSGVTK